MIPKKFDLRNNINHCRLSDTRKDYFSMCESEGQFKYYDRSLFQNFDKLKEIYENEKNFIIISY